MATSSAEEQVRESSGNTPVNKKTKMDLGKIWASSIPCLKQEESFFLQIDQFKITEIICYENYDPRKESGSVYFSSLNPVYPILACGLTKGNILLIEGEGQSDCVNTWANKIRLKTEETSAMTDFGWNVNKNCSACASLGFQSPYICLGGRDTADHVIFGR